jgi:hypothetical protein
VTVCVLRSVGFAAPGLAGWNTAREVLRGAQSYTAAAETPYSPALLPPNERRRATASVRLAFRAAEEAVSLAGADARGLASVFASSDADMAVLHRICGALAAAPRVISPTDFHNSVHNAASGYWSIGVQSMQPTTTLAAYDASFAMSLIEAAGLVAARESDVLAVAFDAIAPQPLLAKRPLGASAGVALILGKPEAAGPKLGTLEFSLDGREETRCARADLEALRVANPALRALPLLELVAAGVAGSVELRATGSLLLRVVYSPGAAN